jgi:nucleoside-diphosphate-sugar epimerase
LNWKISGILEKQSGGYGMNETVLITGGTGFIGSHVIEHLLDNGYRVILLKRSFSKTWRINEFKDKITCYNIDEITLDKIFQKESISAIIHLATYYKKHHTQDDIDPMIRSNILFPVELLENAKKFDVKTFINTGTFFEYDYNSLPIHENSHEKPFNFYAITKLAFENILKSYTKTEDIKSITLKIFSPYGPHDNEEKIVPLLINHALKNREIKLSHGLQKLDFIYVKDIAEAYISSLKNISMIEKYEAINIGTGFPYSIRDIVSLLEEIMGSSMNKIWSEPSNENLEVIYPDIEKAHKILKWKPKYSLKRGLEKTLEYYSDKNDI